jgi:hypothetical protein
LIEPVGKDDTELILPARQAFNRGSPSILSMPLAAAVQCLVERQVNTSLDRHDNTKERKRKRLDDLGANVDRRALDKLMDEHIKPLKLRLEKLERQQCQPSPLRYL